MMINEELFCEVASHIYDERFAQDITLLIVE